MRYRLPLVLFLALLFHAIPAHGIAVTPFNIKNCSNAQNAQNYTAYTCRLPNLTLSGNTILVGMNLSGGGTVSVTDDCSQTYTIDKTLSGGQITKIARFTNTAAGCRVITINFTSSATFVGAVALEVAGLAASPVDVSCSAQASGTSVTCGSMTTTVDGDLIFQYGVQDTNGATKTTWTVGSAPFAFSTVDSYDNQFSQYQIQTTHGAINPTVTMSPTDHHTSVGVAYKADTSKGTLPSAGIRVFAQHSYALNPTNGYATGSTTLQVPCTGNLIFMEVLVEPNVNTTTTAGSVTDTQSNTFTRTGTELSGGAGGGGNLSEFYATGASCSTNDKITFTTSGTQVSGSTVQVFDVTGAATSAYDSTTGRITATGTQGSPGSLTAGSITPSTSNGLVFGMLGVQSNTVSGVTISGNSPNFLSTIPTPDASPNPADQNNGWMLNYNTGTSAESVVWSQTGGAFNQWAFTANAFKAPAATGPPANQFPRVY